MGKWDPQIPLFGPERLGFNVAWIAIAYLGFQLLSIPFAYSHRDQFIGIFDAMASLLPLAVVGTVLVGAAFFQAGNLLAVPGKWRRRSFCLRFASWICSGVTRSTLLSAVGSSM
jgi:hypothetical protein